MIKCKRCGCISAYTKPNCPACNEIYSLTAAEVEEIKVKLNEAVSLKDCLHIVEYTNLLADLGIDDYEYTYASMLEQGSVTDKNVELAKMYYYRSAQKNNPQAAYRYAMLEKKTNDDAARFWMAYACILECREAYMDYASLLSRDGSDMAVYYYSLAAEDGERDAIVALAKMYYEGTGVEKNDAYAKWYIDKLKIPTISSMRMYFKLRNVIPVFPGKCELNDREQIFKNLAEDAKKFGYSGVYHNICSILAEEFNSPEAKLRLGVLYLNAEGCEKNVEKGIELLTQAAEKNLPEAYKYLGDMYISGTDVEKNSDTAISYYEKAAKLGMSNAYEMMGDIFYQSDLVERDIPKALEMYDIAAADGHESAKEKADKIREARKGLYDSAMQLIGEDAEKAFRMFAVSAGMGYLPAYSALAECYVNGIGVKKDRHHGYLWYKEGVRLGDRDSILPLALCYSRGIGVRFNMNKATELLAMADMYGIQGAREEMLRLLERKKKHMARAIYSKAMSLVFLRKFKEAKEALDISYRFDNPRATYTLACMYEFGLGTPANRGMAIRLFDLAYDLGFRDFKSTYKSRILKLARNYMGR